MDRTILHCDLNNFYASVECLYQPALKNVPMVVSGNVDNRHGIILAKNEIAKGFGIVTAETVWKAKQKCPELVLIPPHHDRYTKYSKIVRQIFDRFTDMVEPFGIDEAWLDVTGSLNLFGNGKEIADNIRETVKKEIGLTVSLGVSFNKIFAKLGSDYKKPDATTVIDRDNYKEIVYPLSVSALLYVGKAATASLTKMGIATIGQLANYDKKIISNKLGKMGLIIHNYANGIDDSPVRFTHEQSATKSVGKGLTFKHNLVGIDDIKKGLMPLADNVATRLRHNELKCSTVQVSIRDPQFKTITRQKKLNVPTHLLAEIASTAIEILESNWNMKNPIRMLTITGTNLVSENVPVQISFLNSDESRRREKLEKIEQAVDNIRGRYGQDVISLAATINNKLVDYEKIEDDQ